VREEQVRPSRRVKICRDPDDDRVIEAALEGRADFIVSGDDDLIVLVSVENIQIVSPSEFLRELGRAI
jgi:predicted nucleic acid-binding protein